MTAPLHQFEIVASYGPPELFAAVRAVCESSAGRAARATFDFDWMKRGIWIESQSAEASVILANQLAHRVAESAGPGSLIVGRVEATPSGRHRQAIGVLLQTPDVFIQVMSQTLTEIGVIGILLPPDGDKIEIPQTKANLARNYAALVRQFPLPPYLRIEDRGLVDGAP